MERERTRRFLRALGWSVCSAVLFVLLTGAGIRWLVANCGRITGLFVDSDGLKKALGQLSAANVVIPVAVPLIFGAAAALIVWKVFSGGAKTGMKVGAALLGVLLLVMCFTASLLLTKVNSVPVWSFLRVLLGYLSGGGLDDVL